MEVSEVVKNTEAPTDVPSKRIDVRDLPPPQPLKNTLEELSEIDDNTVLIQINDRAPQFLYPKIEDRGYEYESVETDEAVVTVIWRPRDYEA